MNAAYFVHGMAAPLMPFQIPYEAKLWIRSTVEGMESASGLASSSSSADGKCKAH